MFKLNHFSTTLMVFVTTSVIFISTVKATELNDTGLGKNKYSSHLSNYFFYPKDIKAFSGQDPQYGRDALEQSGKLNKIGSGHSAFDFTDKGGCIVDNVTGLMWEEKQDASHQGLQSNKWNFTWRDDSVGPLIEVMEEVEVEVVEEIELTDKNLETTELIKSDNLNQGVPLVLSALPAVCGSNKNKISCDTQTYIEKMNGKELCGYTDWRLPTREELRSIVDYSVSMPSVDKDFFPNMVSNAYWTSSLYVNNELRVWVINFEHGGDNSHEKHKSLPIRLVRKDNNGFNKAKAERNNNQNIENSTSKTSESSMTDFFSPVTDLWK